MGDLSYSETSGESKDDTVTDKMTVINFSDGEAKPELCQTSESKINGTKKECQGHMKSQTSKCSAVTSMCSRCVHPFLATSHPLQENPTTLRKIKQWFLFPPSGKVAAALLTFLIFVAWCTALVSITKKETLPGGSLFPILITFMSTWCGGYIVKQISLPPLLGMLIAGVILGNVPVIDVARQIIPVWSSTARSIALTIILTRVGLSLDPVVLKRLSFTVLRLALCPSITEVIVDGVAARYILDLSWTWAIMLGFVLAAVSPAVIVPSLLLLSERGYGLNKGVPTLVTAACSLDAILAITGFEVMLGINFSTGDLVWGVCKIPLQILVGAAFGIVYGVILWYLPQKSSKNLVLFRTVLLFAGGLIAIFGSKAIGWSGSGPLGCVSSAFVAAYRWRDDYRDTGIKNPVEDAIGVLWMVFQPLLFGLIGAVVNFSTLDARTAGFGIAVLFIGVSIRLALAFLMVQRTNFNVKERFFILVSWFPKATVQASIGAIAYDTAVANNAIDLIPLGRKVLSIAVLAILITAPIGSFLINTLGPRLLHRTDPLQPFSDQNKKSVLQEKDGQVNHGANFEDEQLDNSEDIPTTKL